MNKKLIFHPLVKEDIKKLDKSLRIYVKKALNKIKEKPDVGKLLGNKNNRDLSNCRKVYFFKKKYRIVYEILNETTIVVWSIGKRGITSTLNNSRLPLPNCSSIVNLSLKSSRAEIPKS